MPDSTKQDFINAILPLANEVYKKTGILQSVTIAQGIQETGGTLSNGLAKVNNFFGEKGTGDIGSVSMKTWEQGENGAYTTYASFKKYSTPVAAATGRIKLLSNSRYSSALKATDFDTQTKAIKAAGYATDPNYVSSLQNIYKNYNLSQYDTGKSTSSSNLTAGVVSNTTPTLDTSSNIFQVGVFSTPKKELIRIGIYIILIIILIVAVFMAIGSSVPNISALKELLNAQT